MDLLNDLSSDDDAYLFHMSHYSNTRNLFPGNMKAPKYLSMLHRLNRGPYYNTKAIVKTSSASYLHNHWPAACLREDGSCKSMTVPADVASLHHYRAGKAMDKQQDKQSAYYDCGENDRSCGDLVRDERILVYQDELIKNVKKVLRSLHLA